MGEGGSASKPGAVTVPFVGGTDWFGAVTVPFVGGTDWFR
jgi:hypothetical protein